MLHRPRLFRRALCSLLAVATACATGDDSLPHFTGYAMDSETAYEATWKRNGENLLVRVQPKEGLTAPSPATAATVQINGVTYDLVAGDEAGILAGELPLGADTPRDFSIQVTADGEHTLLSYRTLTPEEADAQLRPAAEDLVEKSAELIDDIQSK